MRLGWAGVLIAGLWTPAFCAPSVIIVTDREDAGGRALAAELQARLKGKLEVRMLEFGPEDLADPIAKGQFVASLQTAGVVVPVGDSAASFVNQEVEEVQVYFVGAALLRGEDLSSVNIAGELSYSPEDVLSSVPEAWRGGLGLFYTSGYEPLLEKIRAAAEARGVRLIARKLASLKDLPRAAKELMGASHAVWILGDPELAEGAAFEYLVQESLSRGIALIGSEPSEVRRGAVFCDQATPAALASGATTDLERLISEGALPSPRVRTATPGGHIIYRPALAGRFELAPEPPQWVPLP